MSGGRRLRGHSSLSAGQLHKTLLNGARKVSLAQFHHIVHFAGGGPALKGLMEGRAAMMFEPLSAAMAHIKEGKLRPLAVTTAQRAAALPGIPALAETVPGFEASAATGIGVPKDTPAAVIDTLNKAMNAAFADPAMQARFAETGGAPLPGSSADFGKLLAAETEKWAKVVKFSGTKSN